MRDSYLWNPISIDFTGFGTLEQIGVAEQRKMSGEEAYTTAYRALEGNTE